ncbi:hypothetical protein [Methylophilus sp. 3sh_L]|uniref:hypothetical protein n=1 Tax=Methylophilus sp. 3sh_L TaxID=3377114 RepID=UPI00398F8828
MKFSIRLLIVEDDAAAINEWGKHFERHNAEDDKSFEIIPTFAESFELAKEAIVATNFDAAIVDLRLKVPGGGGHHNADGNEVVKLLANAEMAAVAIYTGQPEEAQLPNGTSKIEVIPKDDGLETPMQWLKGQGEMLFHIQKVGEIIRSKIALTFHGSIWPRWKNWSTHSRFSGANSDLLISALTRHFVSHLHADLLESTNEVAHSEEWYFVPAISSSVISTGDMIRNESGAIEIVVTPRCDIAHSDKSITLQLAQCEDISVEWNEAHANLTVEDKKTVEKAKNKISSFIKHRSKNVIHFLPPMFNKDGNIEGPWFVRFDCIRSEKKSEELLASLNSQRFATLAPEFLPALVERLGGFFSRIGSPDYPSHHLE